MTIGVDDDVMKRGLSDQQERNFEEKMERFVIIIQYNTIQYNTMQYNLSSAYTELVTSGKKDANFNCQRMLIEQG